MSRGKLQNTDHPLLKIAKAAANRLPSPDDVDELIDAGTAVWECVFGQRRKEAGQFAKSAIESVTAETGKSAEELASDPVFVSSLAQALPIAFKTHQEEKKELLRQSLLSIAQAPTRPQEDVISVYMGMIDSLTPSHVRLLSLIKRSGYKVSDEHYLAGAHSLLQRQGLNIRSSGAFRQMLNDLENRLLVQLNDARDYEGSDRPSFQRVDGPIHRRGLEITQHGLDFLKFLRQCSPPPTEKPT